MSSTPQTEDGYLMIANELLEAILGFGFSLREQSVLFTIIRKTYGFKKREDDISASQIGEMCRVPRQHVTTTLNMLALRNVITKRAGRYGSIIGIQKNHRKWITNEQMKAVPPCPESGQVIDQGNTEMDLEQGDSLVPSQDTCPETGHVPNWVTGSPKSGQVDSPDLGHTKENLPKENQQKKQSCAPQAERESDDAAPADRKGRARTSSSTDLQDRFARFYAAYPRKKSRISAEKAFAKLNPDEQLLTAIIAGIERAMTSGQWSDPKFIPHPATWLNGGGWLDEIQTEYSVAELGVIELFNAKLGTRFGEVPAAPFLEQRAALIREFPTFSKRPNFVAECFDWLSDSNIEVPPKVGFDWIISRAGFTKILAANNGKSA
jgi:phage replication O-like protein O